MHCLSVALYSKIFVLLIQSLVLRRMSGLSINRYRPIIGRLLDADNRPLPCRCISNYWLKVVKQKNCNVSFITNFWQLWNSMCSKMLSFFGFKTCIKANSTLVNRLINDTLLDAYCLTTFQSDTTSNLIRWFAVFNFSKNIKQAGDGIFSGASLMCNKLSEYGVILQSYCTNTEGCNFYASQCGDDHDSDWLPEKKTLTENCPPSYKGTRGYQVATGPRRRFPRNADQGA